MAKNCAVHSNAPSVGQCFQCQKPVCKSCVMITPAGSFCSTECHVVYREMKHQGQAQKKKMRTGTKLALFFVIVLGAFLGVHIAVYFGADSLKSVDVIGRLLKIQKPDRPAK